jgi:hypothetical protein
MTSKHSSSVRSTKFVSFLFLIGLLLVSSGIEAQHTALYADGSLGVDRNYVSFGFKQFLTKNRLFSIEAGGGLLGIQTELASSGNSANLTGVNGYQSSIASSNVIAADPNVPDHSYPGSITTKFTGSFVRGSYEWRFPSKTNPEGMPGGLRIGVELAYFSIIQHQDIQYRSFASSETYDYSGTAWCAALAPGLRMGYDFVICKHVLIAPEIATPFYIPIGSHAKSNGPFGKQSVEVRLGIGWIIR